MQTKEIVADTVL